MRNGEKEGEGREIEGKVEVRWEGEEHLKPEKVNTTRPVDLGFGFL